MRKVFACFTLGVVALGCARPTPTETVKNAYIIYRKAGPDLAGPPEEDVDYILEEFGRRTFADALVRFADTKYAEECIFCIGVFGDERDIEVVRRYLQSPHPKIRRVAENAYRRLSP